MSENYDEMPKWAKELTDRIEAIGKKFDEHFPETDKRKPDFSKLKHELDMNAEQLGGDKTIF
jgi:hypothetical protein